MSSAPSDLLPPPSRPLGPALLRRPGSVRRTSSIDTEWPTGRGGPPRMVCRGRDILTPADGGRMQVLDEIAFALDLSQDRTITAIDCNARPELQGLVGARGGGRLRQAVEDVLPGERERGSLLYLLLDDLSGASLVAGWAWSRWEPSNAPSRPRDQMVDICIGFASGSEALEMRELGHAAQNTARVPSLANPADPEGWHALPDRPGVNMRRARRIDVWLDDALRIDAMFQDSASAPGGGRIAVHEYQVCAMADPSTGEVTSLTADPRVLPYRECPGAVANLNRMVGTSLPVWRGSVLTTLARAAGCTHLNDALRSLAEAPILAKALADPTGSSAPG